MAASSIRVGIGGWDFDPWRGTFYPQGLPRTRQLEYAAQQLTAIEINSTFYSRQKPATFAKWAASVPDGFRFALKASRYCVTRPKLADAGEGIANFLKQGIVELGDRLGPILWQLAPTRRFDADDIAAFLKLLPAEHAGLPLRHALEPRHDSFADPAFAALAKAANAAIVYADSDVYPLIDAATADFAYARLQRSRPASKTGYPARDIARWAEAAQGWARGGREAFVFFISGAKVRNPAAAMALIKRLAKA
jgi:uncharacterized protein YecE (DUF72 family)